MEWGYGYRLFQPEFNISKHTFPVSQDRVKKVRLNTISSNWLNIVDEYGLENVEGGLIHCDDEQENIVFKVGERYSLQGKTCDGFTMRNSVYELVGEVDDYSGVPINSFVLKYVGGDRMKIYTLSKNDCEALSIQWENGLILMPKALKWKRHIDREWKKEDYNPNDISTYRLYGSDMTVRYLLYRIDGFECLPGNLLKTPWNTVLPEKMFFDTLTAQTNKRIAYNSEYVVDENTTIPSAFARIKSDDYVYNNGNAVTSTGSVFIMLCLKTITKDGVIIGIDPRYVEGLSPYDLFSVTYKSDETEVSFEEYTSMMEKKKEEEEKKYKELEDGLKEDDRWVELNKANIGYQLKYENSDEKIVNETSKAMASIIDIIDGSYKELSKQIEEDMMQFTIAFDNLFNS